MIIKYLYVNGYIECNQAKSNITEAIVSYLNMKGYMTHI